MFQSASIEKHWVVEVLVRKVPDDQQVSINTRIIMELFFDSFLIFVWQSWVIWRLERAHY